MYLCSHNPEFGTLNLIDAENYRGTALGGLTWSADGVQGNGLNGYIDTNFNPSVLEIGQKYQLNNASLGGIKNNPDVGSSHPFLSNGGNIRYWASNIAANTGVFINNGTTITNLNPNIQEGFFSVNRESNVAFMHVLNGSLENIESLSTTLTSSTIKLLNHNTTYSRGRLSFVFIGASLTFNQTQNIRTAFNNLRLANGLTAIA